MSPSIAKTSFKIGCLKTKLEFDIKKILKRQSIMLSNGLSFEDMARNETRELERKIVLLSLGNCSEDDVNESWTAVTEGQAKIVDLYDILNNLLMKKCLKKQ
jgi:hypothetical protein